MEVSWARPIYLRRTGRGTRCGLDCHQGRRAHASLDLYIVKEDVQSLTSSLTSAQGPAASASMKERTAAQLRKDAELHNRLLAL
jgi:hypothetical protein